MTAEELEDLLSGMKVGDKLYFGLQGGASEDEALFLLSLAMRGRNDGTTVCLINDKRNNIIALWCANKVRVAVRIFVN